MYLGGDDMEIEEAIDFIESKKPSNFTGRELNNVREEKITEEGFNKVIKLLRDLNTTLNCKTYDQEHI